MAYVPSSRLHDIEDPVLSAEFDAVEQAFLGQNTQLYTVEIAAERFSDTEWDLTMQVKDLTGKLASGQFAIRAWLADSATGVMSGTAATSWTFMDDCANLAQVAATRQNIVLTDTRGWAKMRIEQTAASVYYFRAALLGKVVTSDELAFV